MRSHQHDKSNPVEQLTWLTLLILALLVIAGFGPAHGSEADDAPALAVHRADLPR